MPTPHPPRPAYPPGGASGECDESLAARLRGRPEGGATQSVALLMARHWQSTYDYSVICLASSSHVASMVAATSFHYALDCLMRGESGAALRPRLLVTVRDTVKEWSAEDRISGVLPDLGKPAGGRGMRVAGSMAAENRKLAERSFQALPGSAQCLLWHTEVEAEPISVPAGLSGMDIPTATAALEQAREQFRQGFVRAHRELAPSEECGFYNRLLDVLTRRGGALSSDVRHHLAACAHCRHTAEQLGYFEGELGALLAEAVLGWGARRYLDTRSGGARQGVRPPSGPAVGGRLSDDPAVPGGPRGGSGTSGGGGGAGDHGGPGDDGGHAGGGGPASGGRHRLLARIPAPGRRIPTGQARSKALLTGAGTVSALLLVTVLAVSVSSSGGGGADPAASTGVGSSRTVPAAPGSSPPTSAGLPAGTERTRLRNLAADLCLDIRGGRTTSGAETELAVCSSARTQQWSYEDDGLLRSVADPGMCLDSGAVDGVVALNRCVGSGDAHGDDVRYDLTVRGELLPRARSGLAVAPGSSGPDAVVVVKDRSGSDAQRWRTDSSSAAPRSLSIAGTAGTAGAAGASTSPVTERASADGTTGGQRHGGPGDPAGERPTGGPDTPDTTAPDGPEEPRAVSVDDRTHPEPVLPLPVGLPPVAAETAL
ncbi:RICIN domain-containing protein [Streptomyces sp. NPDC002769]|uniref:RICIN domain-containing protein n=1 Tax=Streptomyces sp. NPDC002769 TaxID=3154542 RepID=UPI00332C4779